MNDQTTPSLANSTHTISRGAPLAVFSRSTGDVSRLSSPSVEPATSREVQYQLLASGAPLRANEVETAAEAVEIRVLWGGNLLHVSHLSPARPFRVGERAAGAPVDVVLPADKIGELQVGLLEVQGGVPFVTIPAGGRATITTDVASGSREEPVVCGARVALSPSTRVRVELADFTFEIAAVPAGRKVAASLTLAGLFVASALPYVLGAGVGLGGLLGAAAMFTPELGRTNGGDVSSEQRYLISHYLTSAAEHESNESPQQSLEESNASDQGGGTGTAAKGESGTMGSSSSRETGRRYGVSGPADNPDPHLARQAALRDAADFGMVGLLNQGAGGDPDAPTAPWGRDDSLGLDSASARGAMWGDSIGESSGFAGLGLSGIGEGGGGRGEGLGLGNIGTLGHGAGLGNGQLFGNGIGSSRGRSPMTHVAKAPSVRTGNVAASGGRLPAEVIQRIIRQNHGRFRACYESGLRSNPSLVGTVSVRFVIGRDGGVSNVGAGGDLPDATVTSCVARSFSGLSFPRPDEGVVRVSYPISFVAG